ncbi:Procollagen-proline 3-dioxygenase protein [Dioscorea alata]|uniref:Procollagen-proline 3-dioxygenase protein n=2 Tax=Dioscorea alata TaxID=55571 RepID=A0ACB7U8F1_DIOAL|nr:Procollagen-proline 3-dioxygenase protein [Dioscorea alata]KAH7656596.1 Procollagen-proline 3-dioxygenase protein [Dioscorea alata]
MTTSSPPTAMAERPRLLLHNFITVDQCKELEFIHRSCGVMGYRPGVLSTTLSHLIATNCPHLILPFVSIRNRIKDLAEDFFSCHFDLFLEFTGLISWCKGASIGWHSDDNRPYLKQRDFAAVCYLNSHGKDFKGGVFHFKDGEPASIFPVVGDVLIYTADSRNIHSVDEVTEGERLTLTLWFTRDSAHDEDAKLISLLSQRLLNNEDNHSDPFLPVPASDNMYWFPHGHDQLGFDVRCARVHILGYNFCSTSKNKCETSDSSCEELLARPLQLSRGDVILGEEFANSLHALQVVQFYYWKAHELKAARKCSSSAKLPQPSILEKTSYFHLVLPGDLKLAEDIFGCVSYDDNPNSFDWDDFALAIAKWKAYIGKLHKHLVVSLPQWINHQIMYLLEPSEVEKHND